MKKMKYYFSRIVSLFICLFGISQFLYTQNDMNIKPYYSEAFKEADKLLNQNNLPKSALEKINEIWKTASDEKNEPEQIKALIYWSNATARVSESTKDTLLPVWLQNIEQASGAHKAVLQSVLAEMIWNYLEGNRWLIHGRTTTEAFEKSDMATWSEKDFEMIAAELYLESVSHPEFLKIQVGKYSDLLTPGQNSDTRRPFLFDVLVARAVEHFTNTRNNLHKPVNPFRLNDDALFLPANQFVRYEFTTQDTISPDYRIVSLLQQWLLFHETDTTKDAWLDADLARLEFVNNNSTLKNKSAFYRERLSQLIEQHKDSRLIANFYARLAMSYMTSAAEWDGTSELKKWDYKTAFDLATECVNKYGKLSGTDECKNILNTLTQLRLNVTNEEIYTAGKPLLVLLNYNQSKHLYYSVIKTNNEIDEVLKKMEQYGNRDSIVQYLSKLKVLESGHYDLPNRGDFRENSVEFMVPSLDFGSYILLFGSNSQFTNNHSNAAYYSRFDVSNLTITTGNSSPTTDIMVTDRNTGQPLKDVIIRITELKSEYVKNEWVEKSTILYDNIKTDKDGFVHSKIALKAGEYNSSILIEAYSKKDYAKVRKSITNYREPGVSESFIKTNFYTDRAIYRPGQTIYFKGLVLSVMDGRSNVLAGKKIKVQFRNANSQKIDEKIFTTNEFGSFDGSFTAPTSGLFGQMSLVSDEGGVQWISVEEYKRPTFEVNFEDVEGEYRLNDQVTMKVKAQAFAGNLITNANVVYRIVRKTAFPFWPVFRYMPYNVSSQEIFQGTGNTGDNGVFAFRFPLIPDDADNQSSKPRYTFEIIADITDQAGETRTATTSLSAGYVGVDVELNVRDEFKSKEKFDAAIVLKNLNGKQVKSPATIRVYKLTAPGFLIKSKYWQQPLEQVMPENEYRKAFPDFAYGTEGTPDFWPKETTVLQQQIDSSLTLDMDIDKWKPGQYQIEVEVKDYAGNPVVTKKFFRLQSDKSIENFTTYGLSIKTEKENYQPGEEAVIILSSPGIKYPVWVEITKGKKVTEAYWLQVKDIEEIKIPVTETDRGNFSVRFYYNYNNRHFEGLCIVNVPFSNKQLNIEYLSFRDKLLPGQNESWKIKISGEKKDKVVAELAATMYDASLDMFKLHTWAGMFFSSNNYSRSRYDAFGFSALQNAAWTEYRSIDYIEFSYPSLNLYGFYPSLADNNMRYYNRQPVLSMSPMEIMESDKVGGVDSRQSPAGREGDYKMKAMAKSAPAPSGETTADNSGVTPSLAEPQKSTPEVTIRQNLKETVFFFPSVNTDAEGNYIIDFKMNEALTRWKLLLFAHTKELAYVFDSRSVITQKDLMIQANMPRFLRQGDLVTLSARISNTGDKALSGQSRIQLLDAINGQDITKFFCEKAENTFTVQSKQNVATEWEVKVPADWINPVEYKVTAIAHNISDGEASVLPVLSDKMLVTETLPLPVRGGQKKTFTLKSLEENNSSTLKHVGFTLEFTANPAWYAVKALPYLSEYPFDCSEQIFSRIYANVLASYVANKNPKIKEYYDQWKDSGGLESNLSKNQDLKNLILNETPWVNSAMSEEEQMRNISLLFDLNRIQNATKSDIEKLLKRQRQDGGFGWFPGYESDWFITQHIIAGFEHLDRLKVIPSTDEYNQLINKGIKFIDSRFLAEYRRLKGLVTGGKAKWEDNHLSGIVVHYLYTRSFNKATKLESEMKEALDYYLGQCEKYWNSRGLYEKGLIALVLHRDGRHAAADRIVKSLRENAIYSEELGMYWKEQWSYYWYQMPVETQSLMIEVFADVAKDNKSVDELRLWLLKNKQTNHWRTTKATSDAIYALLLTGTNWPTETKMPEIKVGNQKVDIAALKTEPDSGYFKKEYKKDEINASFSKIEVFNPNKSVAWGGIYWQYFEQMDKIKTFKETPLKIVKNYFIVKNTDAGEVMTPVSASNQVKLGDKVRVRIEIRVDRMMEYVHLKDMRGSGFEPVNVLSQYKYKSGLGYYESTGDAATNFFISYLPKGTYVFEYDLRANNKGDFSMGISTMQCMYAPEFSSHSGGERIGIK